jgi:hypothetical protein
MHGLSTSLNIITKSSQYNNRELYGDNIFKHDQTLSHNLGG